MGKGEIARYEQFLFFPQCFQKACFLEVSKGVIVWEWVNVHRKTIHMKSSYFIQMQYTSFNPLPDNRILDWSKLMKNKYNIG